MKAFAPLFSLELSRIVNFGFRPEKLLKDLYKKSNLPIEFGDIRLNIIAIPLVLSKLQRQRIAARTAPIDVGRARIVGHLVDGFVVAAKCKR
jgi:hypothetical protein